MLTTAEKRCSSCKQTKSLDEFHRNRSMADGRQSECAECHKERQLELHYVRSYGVTRSEALAIADSLGCEACGADEGLVIDHEHNAEPNMRGVLCDACNRTLGHAKEDPARLRAVADYIEARS